MTVPDPNEFRQLDTIPCLRNCTPKLPFILHPLAFVWMLTPGCFCAVNCCIDFSLRLSYCFCRFLYLFFCTVIFCVPVLAKLSTPFSREGAFLYSGFTFSHYDLPFPTRYCILYVRSGLYQLVIHVKGFSVCTLHCVHIPLRPRK